MVECVLVVHFDAIHHHHLGIFERRTKPRGVTPAASPVAALARILATAGEDRTVPAKYIHTSCELRCCASYCSYAERCGASNDVVRLRRRVCCSRKEQRTKDEKECDAVVVVAVVSSLVSPGTTRAISAGSYESRSIRSFQKPTARSIFLRCVRSRRRRTRRHGRCAASDGGGTGNPDDGGDDD